jgi:cytochrome c
MAQILTFGPKSGEQEYNFPKPGETQATRKVSYLLAAQGTPYVVGAGLYDEKAKLEDLDRLAGGQQ